MQVLNLKAFLNILQLTNHYETIVFETVLQIPRDWKKENDSYQTEMFSDSSRNRKEGLGIQMLQ